jgi:hypothetical protein
MQQGIVVRRFRYTVILSNLLPACPPPSHSSIHPSIQLWLYSPRGPWPLFQFLNLYTVGRAPWAGDHPSCKASTYTQNNTNTE